MTCSRMILGDSFPIARGGGGGADMTASRFKILTC